MASDSMEELQELREKSRSTDQKVLLSIKESAKRAALEDPTNPQKAAAYERASKMLESAMQAQTNFKNYKAVLAYAEECGRKVRQTKLYDDVAAGRLKKQPDGSFRRRDVDRYFASLPMLGTPDAVAEKAAERRRRREEEEIRRIKAGADKDEFTLAVQKGKFIAKERVHLELAARAVALSAGIKTSFEARSLEILEAVEGNPKKSSLLVDKLEAILDEAFNDYSREMELAVEFEQSETDRETEQKD